MKKTFLFLLVLACSFSSCEKDDICDASTITTPRLVISFYDFNNPSELKSVTDLTIIGEGMTEGVTYSSSTLVNGSTVSIPLKTDADATSYSFILNYGNSDATVVNQDELKFNYSRQNIFVSRACGFKTEFTLDPTTAFVHTDAAVADAKWIEYIAVKESSITNENETHLEIYF
ncbi:DUF6452 family protein [Flavobacterium muglaense]|uniref:IPT/TIG domain-containing protein n=1 Tax=Flavobacterium muglaense TaxID=2764716 RepID=A0A923N066_9FLAO|nr:DUF6452 family protein [Flavobacterium muglaense]MBC5838242.1 hypothetical protein [Flavobacterium muglaense]MBC5844777.1 hypothetical protein [Flavobacterium muglaense]